MEVGLLLVLIPWSRFWERNYFAILVPALQTALTNNFVRGAVSGLGLVNLGLALVELAEVVTGRPGASSPQGNGG
ncbi:MAG: hypothetical protein IT180_15895 [Acidobacteria bacterium]|nr:hypothetical protein [Acidobacteriota bacterium]